MNTKKWLPTLLYVGKVSHKMHEMVSSEQSVVKGKTIYSSETGPERGLRVQRDQRKVRVTFEIAHALEAPPPNIIKSNKSSHAQAQFVGRLYGTSVYVGIFQIHSGAE